MTSSAQADQLTVVQQLKPAAANIAYRLFPHLVVLVALAILANQKDLLRVCLAWAEKKDRASVPDLNLWLIVPAACSAGLAVLCFDTWQRRAIAAGIALAALTIFGFSSTSSLYLAFAVPVVIAGYFLLHGLRHQAWRWDLLAAAAITGVMAYAAQKRYLFLLQYLKEPLDPDSQMFLILAGRTSGWATEIREPLFLWLLQFAKLLMGTYEHAAHRVGSVAFGLATVYFVYLFSRRFIGILAGLAAALLYAYSPFMSFMSVRVLREEVIIAGFLLYAAVYILQWGKRPTITGYVGLGLAGAVCIMLRLSSNLFVLSTLFVLFAFTAFRHKLPWRQWWMALILPVAAMLPIVPYLVHSQQKYGDPFHTVNITGARFYANVEFAGKHPDFPTKAQVEADGFAGGKITMGEYLFKYHSVSEVFSRMKEGASEMYFGRFSRWWYTSRNSGLNSLLATATFLGLICMLWPRPRLLLSFLVLVFHAPAWFLMSFDYFDPRLVTVAFAFFTIAIGAAAQTALDLTRRGAAHFSPETTKEVQPVRARQNKNTRKANKGHRVTSR